MQRPGPHHHDDDDHHHFSQRTNATPVMPRIPHTHHHATSHHTLKLFRAGGVLTSGGHLPGGIPHKLDRVDLRHCGSGCREPRLCAPQHTNTQKSNGGTLDVDEDETIFIRLLARNISVSVCNIANLKLASENKKTHTSPVRYTHTATGDYSGLILSPTMRAH